MAPESILPLGANLALFALLLLKWWGVQRPEQAPDRASRGALALFVTLQGAALIWTVVRSGLLSIVHPWVAAMLTVWLTLTMSFLLDRTAPSRAAGAVVVTLSFLIHSYALVLGPAPPQMDLAVSPFAASPWYLLHAIGTLVATGAYVSAVGGAVAAVGTHILRRDVAPASGATSVEGALLWQRALDLALPCLSASIFAYAVWSYLAWGNYWSWRPAGIGLLVLCLTIPLSHQMHAETHRQRLAGATLTALGLAVALLSVPLLSQGLVLTG